MRGELSEKQIENLILSYLASQRILAWKNETVGIWNEARGAYMKKHSIHRKVGISDILGIYKGKFLAIEVKSKSGRLSDYQRIFLREVTENGGISIVARSIEDVERGLSEN